MDARKTRLDAKKALELASEAAEIYVVKGKRVAHIDMRKDPPDDKTLASLLLGPTGNLRSPTLRKGRTLIVGFDETTYQKVLGDLE